MIASPNIDGVDHAELEHRFEDCSSSSADERGRDGAQWHRVIESRPTVVGRVPIELAEMIGAAVPASDDDVP